MIDERDRDRFYRNILSETLPRLVPVSRHKAGIVGEKFLDLIIEYGMPLKQAEPEAGDNIVGWACLTEEFMENYRIPMEKIRSESRKNLLIKSKAHSFLQVANQLGMDLLPEEMEELQNGMAPPYLILRVDNDDYGAAAALDGVLMQMLATEFNSDLYVLFSSFYEAMVIPVNAGMPADEIRAMHCFIQENELSENERLSNSIYIYRRESRTISIIGGDPNDPCSHYQYS